jgi:carboxypeptidase C (cathepsin A)
MNANSWNKKASVLYLELPVGTGFSEGYDEGSYTDETFTKDAIYSLREFFNRFPSYKKNDLYLTGHGYGAVHVAYLAKQIIE